MAKTSPLDKVLVIHGAKHIGPEGCSLSLCIIEFPFSWVPSESDDKITCKACLAALKRAEAFWKLPPEQRVAIGRGEATRRSAKAKKETLESLVKQLVSVCHDKRRSQFNDLMTVNTDLVFKLYDLANRLG